MGADSGGRDLPLPSARRTCGERKRRGGGLDVEFGERDGRNTMKRIAPLLVGEIAVIERDVLFAIFVMLPYPAQTDIATLSGPAQAAAGPT
jgi:hypothetical protein